MLDRAARAALRRRIGMVFQDLRIVEDWSIADNVALPLRIAGTAEREIGRNVSELLAWLGLEKRIDVPASALSGGERRLCRDCPRHRWAARTLDRRRTDQQYR